MKTKFVIGDLNNGDLQGFDTLAKAKAAYDEAVAEGGRLNCAIIEDGGFLSVEDALKAARDFYYIIIRG